MLLDSVYGEIYISIIILIYKYNICSENIEINCCNIIIQRTLKCKRVCMYVDSVPFSQDGSCEVWKNKFHDKKTIKLCLAHSTRNNFVRIPADFNSPFCLSE